MQLPSNCRGQIKRLSVCVCVTAPAHVTKGLYVTVCDYICVVFVRVCLLAADTVNVCDHVRAYVHTSFVCVYA